MTTPVTSAPTTTYTASAVATTTPTTTTTSTESTLATIANSLMGLTSESMHRSSGHPKLFGRMERLVNSIARLIDAIANYKSASKSESSTSSAEIAPAVAEQAPTATTEISTQTPPTTATAPEPVAPPAPEPIVETTPQVEVSAEASTPATRSIDLGELLGKTGGFLWKPVSDKNGDLAILIPKQLTGKVKEVQILNREGTKSIAKGKYSGVGNGNREHYRFTKPGSGYPDGAIVLIKLEDGTARHVRISDTSRRIER